MYLQAHLNVTGSQPKELQADNTLIKQPTPPKPIKTTQPHTHKQIPPPKR